MEESVTSPFKTTGGREGLCRMGTGSVGSSLRGTVGSWIVAAAGVGGGAMGRWEGGGGGMLVFTAASSLLWGPGSTEPSTTWGTGGGAGADGSQC